MTSSRTCIDNSCITCPWIVNNFHISKNSLIDLKELMAWSFFKHTSKKRAIIFHYIDTKRKCKHHFLPGVKANKKILFYDILFEKIYIKMLTDRSVFTCLPEKISQRQYMFPQKTSHIKTKMIHCKKENAMLVLFWCAIFAFYYVIYTLYTKGILANGTSDKKCSSFQGCSHA